MLLECVVVSKDEQLGPLVPAVTTDGSDSVEGPGAEELAILLLLLSIAWLFSFCTLYLKYINKLHFYSIHNYQILNNIIHLSIWLCEGDTVDTDTVVGCETVVCTCSLPCGTTNAILIAGLACAAVTLGAAVLPITCWSGKIEGRVAVVVSLESETVVVDSEP